MWQFKFCFTYDNKLAWAPPIYLSWHDTTQAKRYGNSTQNALILLGQSSGQKGEAKGGGEQGARLGGGTQREGGRKEGDREIGGAKIRGNAERGGER